MPDRSDILDPRKQECLGVYLYGSGYFSKEDQHKAIITAQHAASFCDECPKLERCWDQHRERVAIARPADVEKFLDLVRRAERRGISGDLVAATLAKQGKRDPFMDEAIKNFKGGMAARRRVDLLGE